MRLFEIIGEALKNYAPGHLDIRSARVDWTGVVANYAKSADWFMKQGEGRVWVGCGNRWGVVANYAQADFIE
jgi:hypothetical protein